MQVTKETTSPTTIKFTAVADDAMLQETKQVVLKDLGRNFKMQGFRAGKVPAAILEKNVDPTVLQREFLDAALNRMYGEVLNQETFRPVASPNANITKFVPFTALEATFDVEVIGEIKLADYKKLRVARPEVKVTAKDVDEVMANLRGRAAERKAVERAAKDGDQVTIDFEGVDAKTGEAIAGATGNDYPLVIGSNTFIPGFEPELVGLKAGDEKTFTVTFPKDYGTKTLQSRKVTFTVKASKVEELVQPKLDDKFAATVGPFKTLAELKADVKKQLQTERETQARRDYESEVLGELTEKTKVAIPKALVDEEIDRFEADERQNLNYRGQTWEEHLKEEGVTAEEHREKQRESAEMRVRAGLVLSAVAEREGITVTPDEAALRKQLYKGQYPDPKMQAELDKPEVQREIHSRLMTEKTIALLTDIAAKK